MSNIKLNISQPCHESWNAMTASEQGRFCGSCSKMVVDFSVMTDRQILDYFASYSGNTCGRFTNDQLNRNITPEKQKPKHWIRYALGLMLPALLMANRSYTQGRVKSVEKKCSDTSSKQQQTKGVNKTMKDWEVLGARVKLMGDTVMLQGNVDSTSEIKITLPHVAGNDSLEAPPPNEFLETVDSFAFVKGEPEMYTLGLMVGEVVESEVVFEKIRRFVIDTLTGQSLKLYPNPAHAGSTINISYRFTSGNYFIQVLDLNGRLLQQEVKNIGVAELNVPIRLHGNILKGQYILLIANDKRRKIVSRRFVVL